MSGSASRAKAYRRRQARGVMMVSLPIDQDDTAALERAGFLTLGQLRIVARSARRWRSSCDCT